MTFENAHLLIEPSDILRTIALTAFAGFTSFLGIYISKRINFSQRHIRAFTSFGAGILVSAAIFEMAIEAEKLIGLVLTFVSFIGGSIVFTLLDWMAERRGGGAGILLGMGLDTIPESLAIGAAVGSMGSATALALLIGIQNITEGIAAFREMKESKSWLKQTKHILFATATISIIPIIMGLMGLFYMQGMNQAIGIVLALSAGGIFYMLHYDMIPKAHKGGEWLPTFGATLGFMVGFAIVVSMG